MIAWTAGLVALAVPLAAAGAAAAASLSNSPTKSASVNGRVRQVAYNGSVLYLVGDFTKATDGSSTVTRNHAAAIDTKTGHLLPWNPNVNGNLYAVAVDPSSGNVYLGGTFSSVGSVKLNRLAQVSGTGTGAVSSTFKHPVVGAVYALAVSNKVLYLTGNFTSVNGTTRASAAAINLVSNALDSAWAPVLEGGPGWALGAGAGRIYLGANALELNGSAQYSKLAALNPVTGTIDPTFNPKIPFVVYNIDVTATTVYAAGGGPGGHLYSISLTGAVHWQVTADGDMQAVTDVGGLVIGGGHFDNVCGSPRTGVKGTCLGTSFERKKLFAVDANGNLQAWAPNADSALGVWCLRTNAAGNQFAAGGDFTAFHFKAVKQAHIGLFGFS